MTSNPSIPVRLIDTVYDRIADNCLKAFSTGNVANLNSSKHCAFAELKASIEVMARCTLGGACTGPQNLLGSCSLFTVSWYGAEQKETTLAVHT